MSPLLVFWIVLEGFSVVALNIVGFCARLEVLGVGLFSLGVRPVSKRLIGRGTGLVVVGTRLVVRTGGLVGTKGVLRLELPIRLPGGILISPKCFTQGLGGLIQLLTVFGKIITI